MKRSLSLIEVVTIVAAAVFVVIAIIAVIAGAHFAVIIVCVGAATLLILLLVSISINPDRLRARQSERTLKLAAQTLPYMQKGLSVESAQEVCKLLLPATVASAVAITDREKILGYYGRAMDSHQVGDTIRTIATQKTVDEGHTHIARSVDELGTERVYKFLQAAIAVPLKQNEEVIGVLKFYYKSLKQIDENQQAMAEGLAELLSMQLRLAELEYQRDLAAKMNLKALQAQINPHFLFNTINTIAALIRTDPMQARILLREFATFYRQTLENSMQDTTLDEELTQTLRYLGFEKARFGSDKIIGELEVEEGLLEVVVPSFIVQPIVENAVAHGRRDDEPLHISIKASVVQGQIIITVTDDGVGMPEATQKRALKSESDNSHAGVALKNVAERLEGFFGNNAGLDVQSEVGVGTRITLNLGPRDLCKVVSDDKSDNS